MRTLLAAESAHGLPPAGKTAAAFRYRITPDPVSYAATMNRTVYQTAMHTITSAATFRKMISGRFSFRRKQCGHFFIVHRIRLWHCEQGMRMRTFRLEWKWNCVAVGGSSFIQITAIRKTLCRMIGQKTHTANAVCLTFSRN